MMTTPTRWGRLVTTLVILTFSTALLAETESNIPEDEEISAQDPQESKEKGESPSETPPVEKPTENKEPGYKRDENVAPQSEVNTESESGDTPSAEEAESAMSNDATSTEETAPTEAAPDATEETPEEAPASTEETPKEAASVPGFEGIVLDPTGVPVAGATVFFPELNQTFTTAEDGTFIAEVPEGTHTVNVTAEGLAPLDEPLELDESEKMSGFELLMEFPMEDVVVTGTKTEKLVEKAPVKTQVVGKEKIERKKATTLAETLDATSGVRVESDCQNCGFTQVRLNGLEGRYSQILIDGNPVFSGLAGVYGLEQIPAEMIERVEIVKGGGSALYGGNAVGGVINVITARPRNNFANVTVRGAAVGMSEPEFRLGASAGVVNKERDLALHVFGSGYTREPWDSNDDGFSEIGKARQAMTGAELYLDVPHDGELQFKFHVVQERRRGGDSFGQPEFNAAIAEAVTTRRYGGELRFSQLINSHINYQLGYGFAYTERDSYYGGGGDIELDSRPTAEQWEAKAAALGAFGRTKNPVHTADATMNFAFSALGEQIVTVGGQFHSDGLHDRFPGYGRKVDDTYWNAAGILQHDWIYTDWAESIIGVRLDSHSELDKPIASPRVALMFTPREWIRTRTAFSTGFRAPQVFDEDLHIGIVGGEAAVIYNSKNLDPERSYSVAQQVELDFDLDSGWELKGSINGFWTHINNAFVVEADDDTSTENEMEMVRRNRGATTVFGAEFEAGVAYKQVWGLGGGWAVEQAENSEAEEDFDSKEIFRTPNTYGFFETYVNVLNGLSFNTVLDITGPMNVPHYEGYIKENKLETSPWFADWSANLSYKIGLKNDRFVTPFVGIRNILDSRQDDYDKGPDRDAGYVYGPRQPRSFFAGIKGGI